MSGRYSYLDGVPFAINPLFLPSNKQKEIQKSITHAQYIISNDQKNTFALLNYRHKFFNEKNILSYKIKDETEKKVKKDKSELATAPSLQPATANNLGYSTGSCLSPMPVYSNSVILEPTQHKTEPSTYLNYNIQRQDSSHELFTPSMSLDPFNDMELKTINDLEELKTILQNHQMDLAKNKTAANAVTDLDNFGLPKISFVDLDINSNKLQD